MAETETEWKWSVRHDRAILALLEEETVAEACRASGTQRSTMSRWLKHPEFKARLDRERLELFNAAKVRLLGAAPEAVGTLQVVMRDDRAPFTARVAAASRVLGLCVRLRELEIADKLDSIEDGGEDELPIGEVVQ